MKNRLLKIYLLTIGLVTLVSVETLVHKKIEQLLSDDTRLRFHYSNNNTYDTTITLINIEYYPMDTIRSWTKRILELEPKVLAVDYFSDSLRNVEKIDGSIILPIVIRDGVLDYSTNNITTQQNYGLVAINDYFRIEKYFNHDSKKLPSFALQVIKEFDPKKYSEVIKNEDEELINYRPTNRFKIIDFLDLYTNDSLEPWIKDKIVIIGYLGYNADHIPDILDQNDSHNTPIGEIFGSVIIANQIQTLLNNKIKELDKLTIFIIAFLIFIISYYLISSIKSNRRLLIILVLNLLLIILIGLMSVISVLILEKYNFFISIDLIIISLILGFQIGIISKISD